MGGTIYRMFLCENTLTDYKKDILFWKPDVKDLEILSATLEMEVSKAGKLTFQMPYSHPLRSKVHKRVSRFTVFRNQECLWSGRVLDTNKTFYKAIEVVVEGNLTYLLDSIQRPYSLRDLTRYFVRLNEQSAMGWIPAGASTLGFMIKRHNSEVEIDKRFYNIEHPGDKRRFPFTVVASGEDKNLVGVKESKIKMEDYPSTTDAINENVIGKWGGFILPKYDMATHRNYLVYCLNPAGIRHSNQSVVFGENLTDFSAKTGAEDIYTRCIPLGLTYKDAENIRKDLYSKYKKLQDDRITKYNKAVAEHNREVNRKKSEDRTLSKNALDAANKQSGYAKYKEDMSKYRGLKWLYDNDPAGYKKKTGVDTAPEKPDDKDPETGKKYQAVHNEDGSIASIADFGYDANSEEYTKLERSDEEKLPAWDESGYAMPETVDGNTKITINTTINLYPLSDWSVSISKTAVDYVENRSAVARWGIITGNVDVSSKFDKPTKLQINSDGEITNEQAVINSCKKVWSDYISELKAQGRKWIEKHIKLNTSISISAIDLAMLTNDGSMDYLDVGCSIPVSSKLHGVYNKDDDDDDTSGASMLCSAVSLDLVEPANSTFTIGAEFKTLTSSAITNKLTSGKALRIASDNYSM